MCSDVRGQEEITFWLRQRVDPTPPPFCSAQASMDWVRLHTSEGDLDSAHPSECSSLPEIASDTPRNHVSPALWASLSPVKLAHKLTSTIYNVPTHIYVMYTYVTIEWHLFPQVVCLKE